MPAYYALLGSYYLASRGLADDALAPLAVAMRENAAQTPGAHFGKRIDEEAVAVSPLIAHPLHLLDCCPISDGGAAAVVTRSPEGPAPVRISGIGQAHVKQHLTEQDLEDTGARRSSEIALAAAGTSIARVDTLGVYDSFTVTLALLLEELGVCERGRAGADARDGRFDRDRNRLNTHGGLLSYGHCGVAGGMAHLVEVTRSLRGDGSAPAGRIGLVHADGGVMSAHVTAVLEAS